MTKRALSLRLRAMWARLHPKRRAAGREGVAANVVPVHYTADLSCDQMFEYVTAVARDNPEKVAKLIRLWLTE